MAKVAADNLGNKRVTANTTNRIGALLTDTTRVEAPFIRLNIGGYTFGVYEEKSVGIGENKLYKNVATKYPNYVQSLQVKKINGTVNQYSINISYPITERSDPNFFEKLFGGVSKTRLITIDYGDFSLPQYIYRNEQAIITNVNTSFNMQESIIYYTVEAISTATLSLSGCYSFEFKSKKKPSEIIIDLLRDPKYKLTQVFTGMADVDKIVQDGFIAMDDEAVDIPTKSNMSVLEYISFLVSYMAPAGSSSVSSKKPNVYSLTTYEDTTNIYGGPYFKVQKIERANNTLNKLCTYEVDIGFPTSNVVTTFQLRNSMNWSILYDYNQMANNNDYVKRINSNGELEYVYSPLINGTKYDFNEADRTWWTKVTDFPIQASMTIRGLLKPAILMNYLKVNVWFYGRKHIASGYYIITSQTDNVGASGYSTTLELLRVAPDETLNTSSDVREDLISSTEDAKKSAAEKALNTITVSKENTSNNINPQQRWRTNI